MPLSPTDNLGRVPILLPEDAMSDAEWDQEIKQAIVEFRRSLWLERKREREERETNPWLL